MRQARYGEQHDHIGRRRLRLGIALLLIAVLGFVAFTKLEMRRPTAELVRPVATLGRESTIGVRFSDVGTGLRWARVELESGGTRTVVASGDYPATSWGQGSALVATLEVPLDPSGRKIPEGPVTIRAYADDHSWMRWFRSEHPLLEETATIDLTPPTVEVLSTEHYVKIGGVELAVYKASADTVQSGVAVGPYVFPGKAGMFADPTISAAFFAVPYDLDTKAVPKAFAEDGAGNRRQVTFHTVVKPRRFADKTLPIDDAFLERKVPEILAANGLPAEPDLLKGYLTINRTLRKKSEETVRAATRVSADQPRWEGAFLRQPNSSPLSGFADRRSYTYKGETIDAQTHLGFDLASLRQSPVPAASAGTVVLAGPLGIYGDAVILDHGLGIFTLYGHLSAVTVATGAAVQRGDVIGRTGETGLAGGDHLHFSVMLYGIHVDPVEWWDGKWIQDHVTAKLAAYPRSTVTARHDG